MSSNATNHMYGGIEFAPSQPAPGGGVVREVTTAPPYPSADPTSTTTSNPTGPSDASPNIRITTHYQYTSPHLTPSDFVSHPLEQFKAWFALASAPTDTNSASGVPAVREPEGMCISSVSSDGYPSSRMVLLRGVDAAGWTFYTNYNSRKSNELMDNGKIAVCWYWKEISRQIRAVGRVEKVDRKDSEEYFASRPRGSQIGAWASEQSRVIGEGELEERVKRLEKEWEGREVVCPEHWGGWRIVPR